MEISRLYDILNLLWSTSLVGIAAAHLSFFVCGAPHGIQRVSEHVSIPMADLRAHEEHVG